MSSKSESGTTVWFDGGYLKYKARRSRAGDFRVLVARHLLISQRRSP